MWSQSSLLLDFMYLLSYLMNKKSFFCKRHSAQRFSYISEVYLNVKRLELPCRPSLFILPTCTQTLFTCGRTHRPPVSSFTLKGDKSTRLRYLSFASHPNLFSAPNMQSMSSWMIVHHGPVRGGGVKREGASAADCQSPSHARMQRVKLVK